jgi:hypothetical protein
MEINEYTTEQLTYEINRRLAMEAKEVYERRTAVTRHIRDNIDVYRGLAKVMNSEELLDTLNKINDLIMNCVDLNIMISDGKDFLDAVTKDGGGVWYKYEKTNKPNESAISD